MVGGYKILDLKGNKISLSKSYVPGIYEMLESLIGKPLLVKNFILYDIERPAFFGFAFADSSNYYIDYRLNNNGVDIKFVVKNDDSVTLLEKNYSSGASVVSNSMEV